MSALFNKKSGLPQYSIIDGNSLKSLEKDNYIKWDKITKKTLPKQKKAIDNFKNLLKKYPFAKLKIGEGFVIPNNINLTEINKRLFPKRFISSKMQNTKGKIVRVVERKK